MATFYGGQDRCFGAFIFCIFLLFLVKEKFIFLPFLLPLVIIFYNSFFFVMFTICLLAPFVYKKNIRVKQFLLILAINIFICFLLIFTDRLQNMIMMSLPLLKSYKYYWYNNIVNPFNPLHILLYFILNLNEHSKLYSYLTYFFIAISLLIIAFRGRKAFCLYKAIWLMLLGSSISFLITYPINPVLASKQFVFSAPLFLVFFVSTNISGILIKYKIKPIILLVPLMSIFVVLHPIIGNQIRDFRKYKPVYDYLECLPKDTFIAGYPNSFVVDKIPFFSKRSIFFSDNMDDILYLAYGTEDFKARRQNLISALYAGSIDEVKFFITKYKIDYFIIETSYYENAFYDHIKSSVIPYDMLTRSIIKAKIDKNIFFLLEFARKYHDFALRRNDGDIFIVSSMRILFQ
ncbi:MAG: hypothetical protein KJ722_02845 [Candidatus Omnitrophica bacterium]|nr:hypothetical protein [Candidatus Omnitrophota bacterium]MBU2221536.1 hypothetical protein [Candidatus Omnitrophota bacterium]